MPNAQAGRRGGAKTQGMYFQQVASGGAITGISLVGGILSTPIPKEEADYRIG
jgi:hypothetical protein